MSAPPAFFEGPEKKLEIAVQDGYPSLRGLGEAFWHRAVTAAGAEILSQRENEHFAAYLLSESSLFVYDQFITMITCGRTTLVDAAAEVIGAIDRDAITLLVYERKNEHFPYAQHTSFIEDARRLRRMIDGRALSFGVEHEHSVRMFHSTAAHEPEETDRTLEILMHGIDEEVAATFASATRSVPLAGELRLPRALGGFEIDEFAFEPAGYSLNGMRDAAYVTLHVTPERIGSYVSFETNADFGDDAGGLVREVVERFRPEAFDVVVFEPRAGPVAVDVPGFVLRTHVQEPLGGYHVTFQHFYRPDRTPARATELPL